MSDLFLSSILILMLLFAFIGDLLQYAVRIIVSLLNQPNLSTHLVTLTMLINRFGSAVGLLLIGFMIDLGTTPSELSGIYAIFVLFLGGAYWFTARFPELGLRLLAPFVMRYYSVTVDIPEIKSVQVSRTKTNLDIAIVFNIALLGFLIPSILAAIFPDYRATLLQTGFLLNSFATLYSALKIEKRLVLVLNNGSEFDKLKEYHNFMRARAIGSIISFAPLLLIFLFM